LDLERDALQGMHLRAAHLICLPEIFRLY
jgi:hypothetical protein